MSKKEFDSGEVLKDAWFQSGMTIFLLNEQLKDLVYCWKHVIDYSPAYFCKRILTEIKELYQDLEQRKEF